MPNLIKNIIEGGLKGLGDTAKGIIEEVVEGKKNKAEALLEIDKEANRASEAAVEAVLKEKELENQDRASARNRESEFVKATGHIDYLMWFLAIAAIGIFAFLVWTLLKSEVPVKNEMLIIHTLGIIEGIIVSLFSYYFGSSAGSRIKDMKK